MSWLAWLAAPAPAAVPHVLHISVDAMSALYLKSYVSNNPAVFPNFRRLEQQAAFTYNARCDYDYSETIPNHITMLTGRPVSQPAGQPATTHHGFNQNMPTAGATIHANGNPAVPYKSSSLDMVHDRGMSVTILLGKSRLAICTNSYSAVNGAADTEGVDNGRKKFDRGVAMDMPSPNYGKAFVDEVSTSLAGTPANFTFLHIVDPDTVGHASGWGTAAWSNSMIRVDGYLGQLFTAIDGNPALAGKLAMIIVGDHGGTGSTHTDATQIYNYTVPMFVWGPGFSPGSDLYGYFTNRANPGTLRGDYGADMPALRNGDTANLAMALLGLPVIPGSYFQPALAFPGASRPCLALYPAPGAARLCVGWPASTNLVLEYSDSIGTNTQWLRVTQQITSDGTNNLLNVVPNPATAGRYYRLRQN
jgi:hypothetical protein